MYDSTSKLTVFTLVGIRSWQGMLAHAVSVRAQCKPWLQILAALLLLCLQLSALANSLPQTSSLFRSVTSAPRLQRAILDGVRHIVVGAHVAANELQADPEGVLASLDNAIGDLKPSTRSIVVRSIRFQHRMPACSQPSSALTLHRRVLAFRVRHRRYTMSPQ